jgi:hypothetical protein
MMVRLGKNRWDGKRRKEGLNWKIKERKRRREEEEYSIIYNNSNV